MRRIGVLAAALACLLAGGCGLGAGKGASGVSIVVTRDFGARTVGSARVSKTPGSETVMRFLQRRFKVATRYGGGFVQSIDGLAGGVDAGRPVDWFYYVNGIEAAQGAAATRLHAGDRVWWDRHDWGAAHGVPAVVGSFPEPFLPGTRGKRLPAQIACTGDAGPACQAAKDRLAAVGVKVASLGLRHRRRNRDPARARRAVAQPAAPTGWCGASSRARSTAASSRTFSADGSRLRAPRRGAGAAGAPLGPGAGLIAATRLRGRSSRPGS